MMSEAPNDILNLLIEFFKLQNKNYITPQGLKKFKKKLNLLDKERPEVVKVVHWAASNGDRSENGDYIYGKKRLREKLTKELVFNKKNK